VRIFCFSFVVYLAVLFVQPCQNLTAFADCIDTQNAAISGCGPTSDHRTEAEECSPFCGCSCSGNPIAISAVEFSLGPDGKIQLSDSNFAEYSSPHIKTYQNVIWQPPKQFV